MSSKDEKKVEEVITAAYKVNLHCQQCALDIKKPLMCTEGVHLVDFDIENSEIKVKGVIDVIKIHKQIERLSKKKVELVSPQIKIKETAAVEKKVVKETKQAILRTISVKVHMHCNKCEEDLRKRLLKHKGIFSTKTDMKAQTLTVEGTIESDKLLAYIRKKVHKNAEIVTSKQQEKKEDYKEKSKIEVKSQVTEFKVEKQVEAVTREGNVPYFVHYVYAPQLFSDENPNACSIM